MRKWSELKSFDSGYEIFTPLGFEHFDTAKEAYIYYLDHFATPEDFDYYKECTKGKRTLRDNANDVQLIQMMFDNVFYEKHHIFKVERRADGQVVRSRLA